jgi:bla regulator protein BlaR1
MLIEYVLRTSLIAAAVALVLYGMRIKTASARHTVWFGVVVAMLLLPAWLAWGPKASLPILPRAPEERTAIAAPMPSSDVPAAAPTHSAATQSARTSPNWFAIIYAAGAFTLLLRLAIGTLRTTRLTRASCVVPVTVGFFRPRIILPASSSDWPQARLDAVLTHEREHARRRDPLFQWIALLNRALFWFHPLAWWLERQLLRLAEETCDAAVLAQGHDPHDYSETLLDLSRSVELAGRRVNALAMPMPGAFLPQRIRRMLSGSLAPKISRPRLTLTIAACAGAAAVLSSGALVRAQSNPEPRPTFEVASVKPRDPNVSVPPQFDHGRFSYTRTLFDFILRAYGIRGCDFAFAGVDCNLVSGGPDWLRKDAFVIQATTPAGTPDYTMRQFMYGEAPQLQRMLQVLLSDRFKLKLHGDQRQIPAYVLTVAKRGARLKKSDQAEELTLTNSRLPPPNEGTMQTVAKNLSMQGLADRLSSTMDRPVLDRTDLKGNFDFTVKYESPADAPAFGQAVGESLANALQEQLGLKLESTKAPVEVLVIDHAEQPSPN